MSDLEIVKKHLSKAIQAYGDPECAPARFLSLREEVTCWSLAASALWDLRQMGEA